MRMRWDIIALLLLAVSMGACSNRPAALFTAYLTKFKPRVLPVLINGCHQSMYDKLPPLTTENDTIYGKTMGYAYGTIKTNGNYIAIITLAAADCLLPVITTYDKNGKQIDEKTIAIGQCGDGPGYTCNETMVIGQDYSLLTVDSMFSQDVDSIGNVLSGDTTFYQVVYRKGRLLPTGKIELLPEITKNLK